MTKSDVAQSNGTRRSADSLRLLVQVAAERGMSAAQCLRGTGITVAELADPYREISAPQEFGAIRNLLRRFGQDSALGLQIGLRWPLASSGILGYALLSSPDVRSAIYLLLRYSELTYAYFSIELEEDEREARLIFDDRDAPEDLRRFLVERIIAAFHSNATEVLGAVPPVARVELRFAPPPYAAQLSTLSPVGIRFGAERNLIAADVALLDQPLPRANPLTRELCEQQCRELLMRRRERGGRAQLVRRLLVQAAAAMPDIDAAAAHFSVTGRSLRRQLKSEGTSYRELVDEVRYALAEELLGAGLSIEEVTERLGFSEAASFVRAFRRWSGTTPARARRAAMRPPRARR